MNDRLAATLEAERLVVIVRGVARETLLPLADAMYAGGIRFLEITYSADGSCTDRETAERIALLKTHFGDRMAIGAGTVLTEEQAEMTAAVGGQFIISPDTKPAVIRKTKTLGLLSMPGALTPSEVTAAHDAGADFVKLFPVTVLGPAYVRAIRAPLPHIRLMAVGGINEKNIPDYLNAGVVGFGIGSNIIPKAAIAAGDFGAVEQSAKKYVTAVRAWQPT